MNKYEVGTVLIVLVVVFKILLVVIVLGDKNKTDTLEKCLEMKDMAINLGEQHARIF